MSEVKKIIINFKDTDSFINIYPKTSVDLIEMPEDLFYPTEEEKNVWNKKIGPDFNISANIVAETTTKKFLTAIEKAHADDNKATLDDLTQRTERAEIIADEHELKAGTVKNNESDTGEFLLDKVEDSIAIINKLLTAAGIKGVMATTEELNSMVNIRSNVQEQLDNITSFGNYKLTLETYADLELKLGNPGDLAFVIEDETMAVPGPSIYIHSGDKWEFVSQINGGEFRIFYKNPLDLVTETYGLLPSKNKQKLNASEISFVSTRPNLVANNLTEAIQQLAAIAST